ncbi:MAG TPA: DinB family protein [Thermoanaerobaculia bacterium]
MSTREFFRQRWTVEQPMFDSVFRALPGEKLGYKPHEKSNSAGTIAWMMAEEIKSVCDVIEKGTVEWAPRPEPKKASEIAREFESQGQELARKMESIDDSVWNSKGAFVAGGKEIFSASRGEMAWWILFDLIHHRGQLTAYLRPMGGKVPAIYGPSADDPGQ